MYSVYRHTCPDGKVYIGSTGLKPEARWGRNGIQYKGQPFYAAIEKYGWQAILHEILYTDLTKEEAEKKEVELIKAHNATDPDRGFNKAEGGHLCSHTDETRARMSKTRKGVPHTAEHNKAVSEARKNCVFTAEHIKNMSEAHKGYKMPESQKEKISKSCKGKGTKAVIKCGIDGKELEVFKSITEAAEAVNGKTTSNISSCRKGKRPNAYGYVWKYA